MFAVEPFDRHASLSMAAGEACLDTAIASGEGWAKDFADRRSSWPDLLRSEEVFKSLTLLESMGIQPPQRAELRAREIIER